jgi:outer membrane protein OmpA-like peptidoglycan-associated protein
MAAIPALRALALSAALLLAALAPAPARAADDSALEAAELSARLAALDADPALADKAALERWKARQAVAAVAVARSRDREQALYLARARVATAQRAAQAEALLLQSAQLDRERDQILVEASKREAEAARREADDLRRQAMAREEEAQMAAATEAAERAALEESSAVSDAAAEQALKLADARAEETRLARKEAQLAAAVAADSLASGKPAPAPALRTEGRRSIFTLPGSAFTPGSAKLAPSAIASLRRQFSAIGAKKSLRVEAHTDSQGPDAANLALSQQRAEAVRQALVGAGIAAARISAVGKGEASPVADNATAEGRARNRRVEIVVQ